MGISSRARLFVLLLAVILSAPAGLRAQTAEEGAAAGGKYTYSQEQLDRLLAPIALYPDTLLSQILMAATYPLEVVEADRWMKVNPSLSGDALDEALRQKPWDVSVKSLCRFPRLLATMSEKLDDTQSLGDAFLGQQDQVMDTIQRLRAKARAAGSLVSTDKQRVYVQDQDISIEPVTPDVIYVPAYDPCWAYGPWWYPVCYPPWFWWPGFAVSVGFFWGPPIFVGPIDFWCGFFWQRHRLFVNVNKTFVVGRVGITRLHGGVEVWEHNPSHRRGVAYRSPDTARRFGQIPRPGVEARRAFRGFAPEGRGTAPMARPEGPSRRMGPEGRQAVPPFAGRGGAEGLSRPPVERNMRPEGRAFPGSRPGGEMSVPRPPSVPQPRTFSPFEGFGHSGPEVRQHSERGFQSMGGGARGGGFGGGEPRGGGSVQVPGGGGRGGGRGR